MINLYIIPATLAFCISVFVLICTKKQTIQSKIFVVMVLIFAIHNVCEILGFVEYFNNGESVLYRLRVYYAASISALAAILLYCIEVSRVRLPDITKYSIAAICVGFTLAILFTNQIVSGAQSIGYVMTAIKGPSYILFQISSLAMLVGISSVLIIGYRKSNQHLTQIQCIYMLWALAPLLITCLLIISVMQLGFKINAACILPIASSLFLLITLKSEAQHKLTDARRFMPFSPERQTSQEVMDLISQYSCDEMKYRDCVNEIERLLVMHKYSKNGGNASVTAQSMGMPRSSLYSIFSRLRIDLKDDKST